MIGARIPIIAKMSTIVRPAKPSRLPRNKAYERCRTRLNTFRTRIASSFTEGFGSSDTDTRIENSVQNIGDDVPENDEEGQTDREGRDDGQVRVACGVAATNDPLRDALRPRGEDEVLSHDLEHGGLHQQDRPGRGDQDEGEHREGGVRHQVRNLKQQIIRTTSGNPGHMGCRPCRIAEPPQREPVEIEREQPEEDETNPERRHVVEEEAADDDTALTESTSTPRDEGTDDHTHDVLDDDRATEQEHGSRQGCAYHILDRPAFHERIAEVQAEHVPNEFSHPDEVRIIDPERLIELLQAGAIKGGIRPKAVDRRAGHQIEKEEDNYCDDKESDDPLDSPFYQVFSQCGQTVAPSPK